MEMNQTKIVIHTCGVFKSIIFQLYSQIGQIPHNFVLRSSVLVASLENHKHAADACTRHVCY